MKKTLKKLFDYIERPLNVFVSFHARPKYADTIQITADAQNANPLIAMVIQGPVAPSQDFTLESVRMYKKMFPHIKIILSTWKGLDGETVRLFEQENVYVLLNETPETKGLQYINYQITSSALGIQKARELGAAYVMKTRTDQRIYNPNTFEFLLNTVKKFPVAEGYAQKERIVGVSLNTFKYRPYGISDMTLFGHIDDMERYWSASHDNDGSGFDGLPVAVCEVYLATQYLTAIGRSYDGSVKDSWNVFADHFCIVDRSSIDLYWYKYARMKEFRYRRYGAPRNDVELSFLEWFNMYAAGDSKQVPDTSTFELVIPT